jgi:hypothetical protein
VQTKPIQECARDEKLPSELKPLSLNTERVLDIIGKFRMA